MGGGLGHLQRAFAVLRWLRPRVPGLQPLLLTSSPYVSLAARQGVPAVRVPGLREARALPAGVPAALVEAALRALDPLDMLVVDTFVEGMYGELAPLLGLARKRVLIARERADDPRLLPAWAGYDLRLAPHAAAASADVEPVGLVLLRTPGEALPRAAARAALGVTGEAPLVLAMHAGEDGEVVAFFDQVAAASALLGVPHELVLLTPLPLPGGPWPRVRHVHPAAEVLPAADLVVCGAGYHSTWEARAFGRRVLVRAFARSHDVQAARAEGLPAFDALTGPEELAARMRAALAGPPAPAVEGGWDGAAIAAERVAALLVG